VLDVERGTIRLGIGYKIASGWCFGSFAFMFVLGYGLLRRVWRTDKRDFTIGLLIFATVGYGETLTNLPQVLRMTVVMQSNEGEFLLSSIPYALSDLPHQLFPASLHSYFDAAGQSFGSLPHAIWNYKPGT